MFLRFNFCAINALKRIISEGGERDRERERESESLMARQADCGRDRLQTLPRHWNGVERQTQDILVGVSLYVCVCMCECVCVPVSGCLSISLAVSVCLSVYVCFPGCFSTLRVVWQRLNMPHSDVVLHGVSCLLFSPPLPPASRLLPRNQI